MLKFIRGKSHYPSVERQKIQKELFSFQKTVQHGFPNKPTALAWDPDLRLLAIGTSNGVIKVLGTPGVEFYGQHKDTDSAVIRLFFLRNEGRVISLCDDNSLHLWEINQTNDQSVMEEVKSHSMEGKLKKISACCLESSLEHLLIGTEGGNIYLLNVKTFNMTDTIIYQDVVMYNVPDDYKVNPGAVEAVAEHPNDKDKILIGYNRGLMILWDRKNLSAEQTYVCNQQLENVCWHHSSSKFMSAHNDGSYVIWSSTKSSEPVEPPNTPYGPFPCKAVTKISWKSAKRGDFIIFSGGMPRASYGDRHTVSIMQGEEHVVLDFTSRVIDFFTICNSDTSAEHEDPNTLIVLAEEEIVAVDLETENWPSFYVPYLASLHSSAITCSQHVSAVPEELWDKIMKAGKKQLKEGFSSREWPVNGGKNETSKPLSRELLLTGHEDGTVRFWDASGVALQPLYRFSSSLFFTGDEINESGAAADEEEWPPFRKVGTFDPYSDDPRLAVKKISICVLSGILVIAGTAGQIIVSDIATEEREKELEVSTMNIVSDHDGFVWKGHEELTAKSGVVKMSEGYQPSVILQIHPPAAVLSLCFNSDWGLLAAGTAHGLALFDYKGKKGVISKCTLNPNDLSGTGEYPMSRRKSFKKSLRESFRRLRKGRSQRHADKKEKMSPTKEEKKDGTTAPTAVQEATSPLAESVKPVERQVEARNVDDSMASMVRCLYLAKSYIISVQNMIPTLWAGTNSGAIYVFTITVPDAEKRKEQDVFCQLAKEIQLKHKAPVIAISIVDGVNKCLPEPLEVEKGLASAPDTSAPHRVIICSEEQFKVFTLPSLKPFCKYKLTAHEGSRVRKIGFINFRSHSDDNYSEACVTCLTNQGDLTVVSIPDLRKQLTKPCIRREDINGISSMVFTRYGEGFYLHSSSELQRISLSTRTATTILCCLELPEGTRPLPEPEKKEDEATKEDAEKDEKPVKEDAKEEKVEATEKEEKEVAAKVEQPKENNINVETEDRQENQENSLAEITNNSAADITIDSVKDHLLTTIEETRTTQSQSEMSTEHFEISSKSQQSVTVVTSTTVTTNEVVVNSTGTAVENDECPEQMEAQSTTCTLNEINRKRAPLATMEETEEIDEV